MGMLVARPKHKLQRGNSSARLLDRHGIAGARGTPGMVPQRELLSVGDVHTTERPAEIEIRLVGFGSGGSPPTGTINYVKRSNAGIDLIFVCDNCYVKYIL